MQAESVTPATIMSAAKALLPRIGLGYDQDSPAHLLMNDIDAFIGAAMHSGLGIRQENLGQMLNCSQSKISRSAAEWTERHGGSSRDEAAHA
jgi:hypothetical protein